MESDNPARIDAIAVTLTEPSRWALEVAEVVDLGPHVRRLRLRADGLGELGHQPGQDLMLSVPAGDGDAVNRRYTIRRLDRHAGVVDVDIVRHGDGPGARWAGAVRPGDRIDAVGPRGKITLAPGCEWHLFAGDDSAVPAISAMVEALVPGQEALVFLEVEGAPDEQPLRAGPGVELTLTWLHRGERPPGDPSGLVAAVAAVPLPDGPGHAYLAGELHTVAALRRALIDRGLDAEQLSPKPYWRADRANEARGEPARE